MQEVIRSAAEWAAVLVEALGVGIIAATALYAFGFAAVRMLRRTELDAAIETTRRRLGRGILFGLEFLVAADIIHTVAVELTFETVSVLAIIVAIRTFLSFALEVELTGRWPWQQEK